MVTENTRLALAILYESRDLPAIVDVLESECSRSQLGCLGWSALSMERIWFAVLKLGDGKFESLLDSVQLAQTDWRDLLVAAGFAETLDAHKIWWEGIRGSNK